MNHNEERKEITKDLIESVQDITEARGSDPLVHKVTMLFEDLEDLENDLENVEDNLSFNSNKALGKRPANITKAFGDIRKYLRSVGADATKQTGKVGGRR